LPNQFISEQTVYKNAKFCWFGLEKGLMATVVKIQRKYVGEIDTLVRRDKTSTPLKQWVPRGATFFTFYLCLLFEVNFTKILQAAFVPIFFYQKIAMPNCNYRKAVKNDFHTKRSSLICWWNCHLVIKYEKSCNKLSLKIWKTVLQKYLVKGWNYL